MNLKTIIAALAGLWGVANATPMDPNTTALPFPVPEEFEDYTLLVDNNDPKVIYFRPHEGKLGVVNGMPQLSFAKTTRNGLTFAVLNAVFDFNPLDPGFAKLTRHIQSQAPYQNQWRIQPLPFVQTTPSLAIAGFEEGESCMDVIDIVTGQTVKQCFSLVSRKLVSPKGPTLGEKIAVSLVLTPTGADLVPKLTRGGAGIMMRLSGLYRAAHPAYTARIDVDYKKVYESYAWFMGYHDGVCSEIALGEFFERESLCGENGKNANGRECSVRITYRDSRGSEVQNTFTYIPHPSESEEHKKFYAENAERIRVFHSAIEALQKRFEDEMLTPIQGKKAEVSKDITTAFVLRGERTRKEIEKHFTLERKTVGGVITKQTEIPAATACLEIDGDTGDVAPYRGGACVGYWDGAKRPGEVIPTLPPGAGKMHTTKSGDYPVDL